MTTGMVMVMETVMEEKGEIIKQLPAVYTKRASIRKLFFIS
jgi:hypothetical protein